MTKKPLWLEASVVASEIAITTVLCAFLGYFLGARLGKPFGFIGLTLGAFAGFALVMYRIARKFS